MTILGGLPSRMIHALEAKNGEKRAVLSRKPSTRTILPKHFLADYAKTSVELTWPLRIGQVYLVGQRATITSPALPKSLLSLQYPTNSIRIPLLPYAQ